MKCVLSSVVCNNGFIEVNKSQIINAILEFKDKADLILFGEAYLQGFYSLSFNFEYDVKVALSLNSSHIKQIQEQAKHCDIAVSFGFFELFENSIYSSQIFIDKNGEILNIYRRISSSWKEKYADEHYKEGKNFELFNFMDLKIATCLCGDLWFDENLYTIKKLNPDLILWPVYVDFSKESWNDVEKYMYAIRTKILESKILLSNYSIFEISDKPYLKGGATYFYKGKILKEIEAGKEDFLKVEI